MKLDRTGVMLGIISAVLFSTKPIFIKFVYAYDVAPTVLMALRMGFSLPFYLIFGLMAFQQRKRNNTPTDYSPRTLTATALIGICGYYVASFLDLEGLTRITAQFERLILFTYPIFVAILSALFLGIKFTRSNAISLALTYSGLALIFLYDFTDFGEEVISGALLVLAAAAVFAGYVVFSKGPIEKLGPRMFTCLAMIAASFVILAHFFAFAEVASLNQPWQVYALIMGIAIFATVVPTFFLAEAIARIGPGPTSIMGSVGPIFTTIMAVIILGEKFSLAHLAGTLLIIAGVVWLSKSSQSPA